MRFKVYFPNSPERSETIEAESFTYGEHSVMFFAAKLTDYVNPIAGFPAGVIVVPEGLDGPMVLDTAAPTN